MDDTLNSKIASSMDTGGAVAESRAVRSDGSITSADSDSKEQVPLEYTPSTRQMDRRIIEKAIKKGLAKHDSVNVQEPRESSSLLTVAMTNNNDDGSHAEVDAVPCNSSSDRQHSAAPLPRRRPAVQPGAFREDGRNARDVEEADEWSFHSNDISRVTLELSAIAVDAEAEQKRIEQQVQKTVERRMAEQEEKAELAKIVTGYWCSPRVKLMSFFGMILLLVAFVLVTVLPQMLALAESSTMTPAPTAAPTAPAPQDLIDFLSSASLDGGVALQTPLTPQNKALHWLAGNANLDSYPDEKKIQRYILATLFYSTNGDDWDNNLDWLSDVDECAWYNNADGSFCSNGAVSELDLFDMPTDSGNNLRGSLPEEIALLSSSLIRMDLSQNGLKGTIPSELFGSLTNMYWWSLRSNGLTGTIPSEIGRMTNLGFLFFQKNALTGSIPSEIGFMTHFARLYLFSNNLTGTIPVQIGSLKDLEILYLGNNSLTGTIPSQIGLLTDLTRLSLSGNRLTGTIPSEIHLLTKLNGLWLYNNSLTGEFTCPDYITNCHIFCFDPRNTNASCRIL